MPKQDMKTILIGNKIIDAFLEIANSVGKIITSDAIGNLLIEFNIDDLKQFETDLKNDKFKDKKGLKEVQDIIKEFEK